MIQVNELRIGNKVAVNDFPMEVVAIFKDEVYLDFEGNEGDVWEEKFEDIQPIALTEDLLRKCPIFHESHNDHGATFHVLRDGWDVKRTIEHWTCEGAGKYKGRFHWVGVGEVKYLHEVQNWYYMFEKKELEVNL
jgi:hypothetical protein